MRNYKFRLSALIPSEWFHKLKKMNKPREKHPLSFYSFSITKNKKGSSESKSLSHLSSSYFSDRLHTSLEHKILQISPRNSLQKLQSKRKTVYKPSPPSSSVSAGYNKKKIKDSFSTSANIKLSSSGDVIIDMSTRDFKEIKAFDSMEKAYPETNGTKELCKPHNLSVKININERECKEEDRCKHQKKQKTVVSSGRRSSANSPRIKLKVSSPRIQVSPRRRISKSQSRKVVDSFAVIKSSVDPKKDFRESMEEMIAENNIRASQDLEDLLACYLSLNPKEYHDLIIMVFVQVWFEVINSTLKKKACNVININ